MTEPNLEKLVDSYTAGETSTNFDTKITYKMYDELLSLLSTRSINIQQAMTAILPMLHKDVNLPSKISNITRKVRKHIDSDKNINETVSYLFPPKRNDTEISSFCTEAGITIDNLSKQEQLSISPEYLTNQLIYDLERYRKTNNMPWSEAVKWHHKLFPFDQSDNATEKNISMKWSRNYKKIRHMKVSQNKHLNEYLGSPHIPPTKRKSCKEQVLHTLANPPMQQIATASNPLLAMAEIQGAVMGKYVNKLEKEQVQIMCLESVLFGSSLQDEEMCTHSLLELLGMVSVLLGSLLDEVQMSPTRQWELHRWIRILKDDW